MTGWVSPVARLGGELAALRDGLDTVSSASGLLRPDRLWEEIAKGLRRAQSALDAAEQLYRSYWIGDDEEEVAEVDRREVLGLWRVLLGAAAVPLPAVHRLAVSIDRPGAMDDSLLTSLGAVTRMYAFSYPHVDAAELLPPVRAHLDVLAGWLPEPMMPRLRAGLGSLVAETAAMAGWAALTLNLQADAWSSFTFGRDAARDAGDEVLHAQILSGPSPHCTRASAGAGPSGHRSQSAPWRRQRPERNAHQR